MSIYDTLNDMQREAVFHTEGPVLILAGAGSGKTRVLTHRTAYLIEEKGVNPWHIMAITFTNKAAGEMRERIDDMVGFGSESIWVSTFHSTCVRILRRYVDRLGYDTNFTIYDSDDQKTLMKDICKRLNVDTKIYKEKSFLSAISHAKDELISPEEFALKAAGDYGKKRQAEVYREYQKMLSKNNALDFDDLIVKTVELFRADPEVLDYYQERFRYIMVDEYQDTNTAQFELIRLLADKYHNLCVVGDDDQSIYKFRGANIRNILDFEKVYPEACVIKLEQNYRSTQVVLDAANAVIKNNTGRKDKALWTEKKEGNRIHFRQFDTAYEEAEYIAGDVAAKTRNGMVEYGECAVLYRTNAQARLLEEKFIMEGIPYDVIGGVNFYARREIKDILAYLKTIDNGRDDVAVKRIINIPKRGIGMTTIVRVQEYADSRQISFYDALKEADQIMTIGRSASKLKPFVTMIQTFRSKQEFYSLEELLRDILETTGYVRELEESDEEDAADRIENIDELISKVVTYEETHDEPNLSEFLEEVALVADIDKVGESDNRVLLMTLHSAKGLEFPHIYLAGLEDGIFPSYMTIMSDDPMDIEEERRLAYVGITRAKDDLTITYARQRMIRGETQYNAVSRFVREIPPQLMDNSLPQSNRQEHQEYEADSRERSFFKAKPFETKSFETRSFEKETPYRRVPDDVFDKPKSTGISFGREFSSKQPLNGETVRKPVTGIGARPKAIVRPKRTATENQPYITRATQGVGAVSIEPVGSRALEYDTGDRVRHMRYGEGTVMKIEPGPRDSQVTVVFDEAGQKIMYAGFAKLKKI